MFGAEASAQTIHKLRMIGHQELVDRLQKLKDRGVTTNAKLAKLLGLPSARIAEIFNGTRTIRVDEMKAIVEEFNLDVLSLAGIAPSAENLEPLLEALLPLMPSGRMTDQSRRALAEALSYGLALLGNSLSIPAKVDALEVAARGASTRFREIAPQ